MGDVTRLPVITTLDLNADDVLRETVGKLKSVVIMGYTEEGVEFFASSIADGPEVNWLIDRMKTKLLAVPDSDLFAGG